MPYFGRNRRILTIFGIPLKINLSWFLILALVVWSLAQGYFPHMAGLEGQELSTLTYWLLGVVGAAGLFVSLIAHELSHSIVARTTGMPVSGITLFIFGGVSELEEEPPTAGAEFFMAVVGPISSVCIGAVFLVAWAVLAFRMNFGGGWVALLRYLWTINFLLAAFNSLPAFPLDGGRVLRSLLWGYTHDLQKSTRIASTVGSTFAMILMVGGVLLAFQGVLISGIWLIFIGLFLRRAAMSAMQDTVLRLHLTGERVGRFMTENPVTVSPDLNLETFVDEYVLHYHFTHFPVVNEDGELVGIVRARDPKQVDSDRWPELHVSDVMEEPDPARIIAPNAEAVEALSRLRGEERKRLIVVEGRRPVGIVSLRDLVDFLALKIDLNPRNLPQG